MLVYCVNDGAVMSAWGEAMNIEGSMITFLADTRSELTQALGVVLDHPGPMGVLGNPRCKRFAMYLLRPSYMEYLYVEFVCKCIYVYFTYILDGAGTSTTASSRCSRPQRSLTTLPGTASRSRPASTTCSNRSARFFKTRAAPG